MPPPPPLPFSALEPRPSLPASDSQAPNAAANAPCPIIAKAPRLVSGARQRPRQLLAGTSARMRMPCRAPFPGPSVSPVPGDLSGCIFSRGCCFATLSSPNPTLRFFSSSRGRSRYSSFFLSPRLASPLSPVFSVVVFSSLLLLPLLLFVPIACPPPPSFVPSGGHADRRSLPTPGLHSLHPAFPTTAFAPRHRHSEPRLPSS